jgi:hypothetical protein
MPFPPAAPRIHLHQRVIDCQGYLRDDGLWDIEARIVDTKTYEIENRWRGDLKPGDPVHNMGLRLTIDENFVVQEVATTMDDQPHISCHEVLDNYQRLIGLRIGPGWNRKVKELLGGIQGCTHLVELLGPIGTVAFQTTASMVAKEKAREKCPERYPDIEEDPEQRPFVLDTCHTWRSDGPAVEEVYPLHFTSAKKVTGSTG